MGTAIRLVVLALIVAIAACAARVPTRLRAWQLRGAVTSVRNTTVEVRHKTGQVFPLTLDEQTIYVHNDKRASSEALTRGTRVRIEVESVAGVWRARRVHMFGGGTRSWC